MRRVASPVLVRGYCSCTTYQKVREDPANLCLFCVGLVFEGRKQAMQITIKSKQMDVSPRMRAHIEQKLQRLGRLVGDEARMDVTVVDEKTRSAKDRYAVHLELTNVRHLNP